MEDNTNPNKPLEPTEPLGPTAPEQPTQPTTQEPIPATEAPQAPSPQVTMSAQVAQPMSPMAAADPAMPASVASPQDPSAKKSKKKLLAPLIALGAILIVGGAAATYQTMFNKSPQQLFESALVNTGEGLDTFLAIDQTLKGVKVNGSFDVSTPVAVDGTLAGQWYESNGSVTASVGVAGVRVNSEVRTIDAENSDVPDIYFKLDGLTGLDGLLSTFIGPEAAPLAGAVQSLNDQWYVIDHTLIEQQLAAEETTDGAIPELTEEDIRQISDATAIVLRERLFTVEQDKAVFVINEEIGKEDFEGTGSYKLNVGVNKDNLIAFLESFETVVTGTKLKEVYEATVPGQNVEELFNYDDIASSFDGVDFSTATADVWVEGNGRFIRNIRIYPVADQKDTNYLDFLLPFEGGDIIPLTLRATVDDSGTKGVVSLGIDLNQKNGNARLWFDVNVTSDGSPIAAKAELSIENTEDNVTVEKPADAKSALELVDQLTGGLQPSTQPVNPPGGFDSSQFDDFELPTGTFEL